jgi:hypothetical protein
MVMFWNRKQAELPKRDVQSEAVGAILAGASLLPPKRFADAVYLAVLQNRQIELADLEALANRLSRLAWERGRR